MRKHEATRKHDTNEKDKIRCLHSQRAIKIDIHIVCMIYSGVPHASC